MAALSLNTPIDQVFMVGPAYAQRLNRLNIFTARDLLHHYPARYDDLSQVITVNQVKPNTTVTLKAEIVSCQNIFTQRGKKIQKAVLQDKTGSIEAIWFNQIYLPKILKPGLNVNLSGKVGWFNRRLTLVSPDYELVKSDSQSIHTGRLIPIYPTTANLSSKWLRSRIHFLLDKLKLELKADWLPEKIKTKHHLIDLSPALQQIHFPDNQTQLDQARQRLSFDEMLLLQLEALIRKQDWQVKKLAHRLTIDQEKLLQLIDSLPFKLTPAQNRCLKEILSDLDNSKPMNRLLQGDVGSGKTVIAALAIYLAYLNGFKSILMAPTEILANQHFATLKTVFAKTNLKLSLITASHKKSTTQADILVGTHALLYRQLKSRHIGLIIIDEQHRFGVKQRSQLISQAETTPHLLTMTATPIPRTIALTAYADLDLSVLDEMPPGRQLVKTWVVPPHKRLDAYHWLEKEIKKDKSQAFIVCPLIEASDSETMQDIKNVTQEFTDLKSVFNQLKLDLLHGKLKTKQKEKVIKRFQQGTTDILVSTPVIEVGIDIPNATIMLIENAERFGLAQLHQLRGRVGRGDKSSYCLIFSEHKQPEILNRLKHLEITHSGLKLAELDLKLRGPGDLYGLKQHGFLDLKLASFTDTQLLNQTQTAAKTLLKNPPTALNNLLKQRKIHPISPN